MEEGVKKLIGFLDTGSHRSYIRNSTAITLGLKPEGYENLDISTFGTLDIKQMQYPKYKLTLDSPVIHGKKVKLNLLGTNEVAIAPPFIETDLARKLLSGKLMLADKRYNGSIGYSSTFDILIGCDQYWSVMNRRVIFSSSKLSSYFNCVWICDSWIK